MILKFCAACGEADPTKLQQHHLIPRVREGRDDEKNLITLCETCHGLLHNGSVNIRQLQKEGIAKAKAAGKFKGRKPLARVKSEVVFKTVDAGGTREKAAKEAGISVSSVYRILKRKGEKSCGLKLPSLWCSRT